MVCSNLQIDLLNFASLSDFGGHIFWGGEELHIYSQKLGMRELSLVMFSRFPSWSKKRLFPFNFIKLAYQLPRSLDDYDYKFNLSSWYSYW